jgi:hypothetical protein
VSDPRETSPDERDIDVLVVGEINPTSDLDPDRAALRRDRAVVAR